MVDCRDVTLTKDVLLTSRDLGMLWYGVTGVSFNPADPAEVMLNTGTAAPLLSDHPRPLVPTPVSYSESTATQHTPMLYDPNTGDYVSQPEYMYESYDGYDEDSSGSQVIQQQGTPTTDAAVMQAADESPPALPKSKKPKVHHHPALKLKTPIAYQKDTDLDAIPIMREGMAVCEKCGAIGVKHAFYGKERKFCSLACARGPLPPSQHVVESQGVKDEASEEPEPKVIPVEKVVSKPASTTLIVKPASPLIPSPSKPSPAVLQPQPVVPQEETVSPSYLPPAESTVDLEGSFQWCESYLKDPNFMAVPVSCFKHAPMSECWEQMSPGMKVEVACGEEAVTKDAFWVATVISIAGYKAKLRFEGFVEDHSKDFFVDLCSEEVHPVGWCATQGRPLIPPRTIQHKYRDWKEFLMKRLTGARTLPTNFMSRVVESQKSRFRPGGPECGIREVLTMPNDAPPELFVSPPTPSFVRNSKLAFSNGMKLEAIDPLNLSAICVATVMKVLYNNYLMIRIDSYESDNTCSDWFCYHATSPCIFPAGYCEMNLINLTPPRGYEGQFSWYNYLTKTQARAAPPALFNRDVTNPGFEEGMALESADLMDPRLVCVATVKQVKGRLLKVHFDGWESDFDQWIDCQSPDIYPVGWCDMSGYRLEGPKSEVLTPLAPKRKVKGAGKFGKTGKRGRPALKKVGRGIGVPVTTPTSAPAVSHKRRGRPPKDRNLYGTEGFTEPSMQHQTRTEMSESVDENSDVGRGRRGFNKRDARRSPVAQPLHRVLRRHFLSERLEPRPYQPKTACPMRTKDQMKPLLGLHPWMAMKARESLGILMQTPPTPQLLPVCRRFLSFLTKKSLHSELESSCLGDIKVQEFTDLEIQSTLLNDHRIGESPSLTELEEDVIKNEDEDLLGGSYVESDLPLANEKCDISVEPSKSKTLPGTSNPPAAAAAAAAAVAQSPAVKNGMFQQAISTSQSPVVSSTAVSSTNNTLHEQSQSVLYIPRLIDGSVKDGSKVQPKLWSPHDVAEFLRTNDCGAYCDNFIMQNIAGSKLLTLTQNEIMKLTTMKVGPSLKIHDLVQQLLALVNPAQARYQATLMKRGLSFT
ncbi:LOW QUALITY PROTEIN: polycomb protein Sfmbt-like [Macrobrachium nipponense]|uniref:LOW QUALITY PROTEIN: polycomb protein Sfmbt-like n=1 Tax=Macrobrachium nipponense TaxID=159736 RepID=UPI0030C83E77